MNFSNRIGVTQARNTYQVDDIDEALRNGIWEVMLRYQFHVAHYDVFNDGWGQTYRSRYYSVFVNFLKRPSDTMPEFDDDCRLAIRKWFFNAAWYDVYNFVEFMVARDQHLLLPVNQVLEVEKSSYRFVEGLLVPIIETEQLIAIKSALALVAFAGARTHILRATELFSSKPHPDYRNCIKESISAVESASKEITDSPNATLGEALKILQKDTTIHPSLREAFIKLYGYTSDEKGIRHSLDNRETAVGEAEAHFMIVAASAFISYLSKKQIEWEK